MKVSFENEQLKRVVLVTVGIGYFYLIDSKYWGKVPAVLQLQRTVQALIILTLLHKVFEGEVVPRLIMHEVPQYLLIHYHFLVV